jgi:hypothetical protein
MKGPLNPPLKEGDVVVCYHMDGETSVPPGTTGVVKKIGRDPFEEDGELIEVEWENGSRLALVSTTDAWKKIEKEPKDIQEAKNDNWDFITQNADIYDNFDWRWFREFLTKIKNSGIINMFAVSPLLYAGKDHIERYYGEGREDEEEFQEVLEDADESKDKIIQGVISYMIKNKKNLDDMSTVNHYAKSFSQKILGLYITLSGMTGNLN